MAGPRTSVRIKKIDRYLLTEVMGPFFGGLVFFVFLFLMFQMLRLADFFIVHGAPFLTLLKLTGLLTLTFIPTALPIAFLISILMAFGRLSSDSELVAMKACGMSLLRLATPVLAFAALVSAFSLTLNLEWVPWSQRAFKSTLLKVSNTKAVSSIKEGTFTSGFFDLLVYADKVDSQTNRLYRVFIYDERDAKNPMTIVAQTGEIVPVANTSELGNSILLRLYHGSIYRNDTATATAQKIAFGEYKLYLQIEEGADTSITKPGMIPVRELLSKIKTYPARSFEGLELKSELWKRVAMGLTPFFFVFLGIGFGTVRTRSVRASAAIVAFGTLLTYWSLQLAMVTVVLKGWFMVPIVAMQVPNIILGIVGIWSFRRSSW